MLKKLWQQAIVRYIICAGTSWLFVLAAENGLLDKTDYWTEPVLTQAYYLTDSEFMRLNPMPPPRDIFIPSEAARRRASEPFNPPTYNPEDPIVRRRGRLPEDPFVRQWKRLPLDQYLQAHVDKALSPTNREIWDTRFHHDELQVLLVGGLVVPALFIWRKGLYRLTKKLINYTISSLRCINSSLNKLAK